MKSIVISILLTGILIGAVVVFTGESAGESGSAAENVSVVNGKQVVEITAKGSYIPKVSIAQANMPTVLKIKTRGTFDCSAALTIPAIKYKAMLPPTGETLIEIPPQKPGSTIQGVCAMGMYSFSVNFY